jgi:hypothetical protein
MDVSPGLGPIRLKKRAGAPAVVFDMTEPERPKVDRAVLAFLKSEADLQRFDPTTKSPENVLRETRRNRGCRLGL